jgi:NADPH-dependent ferric siderophore reductase
VTNKLPVRLSVQRTESVSATLRRVVLGGDGFDQFLANRNALPRQYTDLYAKLVFLSDQHTYPQPLDLDQIKATMPHEAWPVLRTYTIRWVDEAARELAIDFVVHGDQGVAGPWAATAQPGDEIHLRGPGGGYAPDTSADWHLLVGDESAIPAISAAVEALPGDARAVALIEVDGTPDHVEFATEASVDVRWLHRGDAHAGTTTLLDDAVRSLDWLPGRVCAFVHGESALLKSVRPYLLNERGVARADFSVSAYWRRGATEEGFREWKSHMKDAVMRPNQA